MQNESKLFQAAAGIVTLESLLSKGYKLNVFSRYGMVLSLSLFIFLSLPFALFLFLSLFPLHKSITHSLRCSGHGIPRAITTIDPGDLALGLYFKTLPADASVVLGIKSQRAVCV